MNSRAGLLRGDASDGGLVRPVIFRRVARRPWLPAAIRRAVVVVVFRPTS